MYHDDHPMKNYEMANKVVVFDRPHAIAWEPGQDMAGDGNLSFGGWIWRYDIHDTESSESMSRSPTTGRLFRPNSASTFSSRRSPEHLRIRKNLSKYQRADRTRRCESAVSTRTRRTTLPLAVRFSSDATAAAASLQRVDVRLGRRQLARGEQLLEPGPLLGRARPGCVAGPGAPADADHVNVVEQQPVYLHRRESRRR